MTLSLRHRAFESALRPWFSMWAGRLDVKFTNVFVGPKRALHHTRDHHGPVASKVARRAPKVHGVVLREGLTGRRSSSRALVRSKVDVISPRTVPLPRADLPQPSRLWRHPRAPRPRGTSGARPELYQHIAPRVRGAGSSDMVFFADLKLHLRHVSRDDGPRDPPRQPRRPEHDPVPLPLVHERGHDAHRAWGATFSISHQHPVSTAARASGPRWTIFTRRGAGGVETW